MLRSSLAAVMALATIASAQNYSTSGPLNITVSQVPLSMRQTWCNSQTQTCPNLCSGRAYPNSCDPETLTYNCTCTDGTHPNISNYQQTIPSFICQTWVSNCIDGHPMDAVGQAGCLSVKCGNATTEEASSGGSSGGSSSASLSSTTATAASGTGSPSSTSATPSATTTGAAVALHVGQHYGTGLVFTGLLAIFGLAL